jgi:hypothetical protein
MTTTVFRSVGPYRIDREIGTGGMAWVFLATDTRSDKTVALKVVRDGPEPEAREILEAEQRGAELQKEFSQASQYVPRLYEVGFAPGYFYIAMEYIDGEDLSTIIKQGPLDPDRATSIAIQLCRFLEEVDRVEASPDGPSRLTLLHNDLKPTNVRLVAGDLVKVLDFGAAKTLSLTKRATRNDFGSFAYLSPECLESGERDRQTDPWALGVLLYEMVAGRQPFRAADTARLERRIRSRQAPDPLAGAPMPLQAVISKLLAPDPTARYENAGAIRADLERVASREATIAEAEGWPNRSMDELPTRRTRMPPGVEQPTRATPRGEVATTPTQVIAASAPESRPPKGRRLVLQAILVLVAVVVAGNEACVARQGQRLAASVPMQEFAGLTKAWTAYDSLAGRSYLGGVGVRTLEAALTRQTLILTERVMGNYRSPAPSVRETQWEAVATAVRRALTISPNDSTLRAALRYSEGHLHRIDGEARKARRLTGPAQREFADAVTAFREAAAFRTNWPDPFLGLARTFIYGIEDIDSGAEAMKEAQRLGYALGSRETTQLADGYRVRGETLERAASKLKGMPQEREFLTRSVAACRKAIELYSQVADAADVPAKIRGTQSRLERIERRRAEMAGGVPPPAIEGLSWE